MSVDQKDIIDFIGIDDFSESVVLTITDHLEWKSKEHLLLLQEKINTYLKFIESGEAFEAYADSRGRDTLINLICMYVPDDEGVNFLKQVSKIIKSAGIDFRYQVHTDG